MSISVGLASGSSYTLTDGEITVEYGEKISLSDENFVVTAILDDGETKNIAIESDRSKNGFTFLLTIPNDEVTPIGEYTITFGHENLAENDYITIKLNVTKKAIAVNALGLTWKDEATPIVYDGEYHINEITNLPEYLEIEGHNDNRGKYPNGDVYTGTHTNISQKYSAVTTINFTV